MGRDRLSAFISPAESRNQSEYQTHPLTTNLKIKRHLRILRSILGFIINSRQKKYGSSTNTILALGSKILYIFKVSFQIEKQNHKSSIWGKRFWCFYFINSFSGSTRIVCANFTDAALPYTADNWRMKNKRNNLKRFQHARAWSYRSETKQINTTQENVSTTSKTVQKHHFKTCLIT